MFSCRTYRYNALNIEEDLTRRWRYLTKKYNYEMINQEPRIGLNGMWKEEYREIERSAIDQSKLFIHIKWFTVWSFKL